jgi:Cof subfamily protein (haloacid dehalogenase superfamily)
MRPPETDIRAVVSDVDGTLVRSDKTLSAANRKAIRKLHDAGIKFAVVSSRPPRGLQSVLRQLDRPIPAAGFNGGTIISEAGALVAMHLLDPQAARQIVDFIEEGGAKVWVFSGNDWFMRELDGPRIALEERTICSSPTVAAGFDEALNAAAKIVAVSDSPTLLSALEDKARLGIGHAANIVRSQSYYLDFTHPLANKGAALITLAQLLGVEARQTACVGDGNNDIDMFAEAGLSIAMGNAHAEVGTAAHFMTDSNDTDGVAKAIEWYVLGQHRTSWGSRKLGMV